MDVNLFESYKKKRMCAHHLSSLRKYYPCTPRTILVHAITPFGDKDELLLLLYECVSDGEWTNTKKYDLYLSLIHISEPTRRA